MIAIKMAYNRHFDGVICEKALMDIVGRMIAAFNLMGKIFRQQRFRISILCKIGLN